MDKNELEKMMDKYKREMLEFGKKNNLSGYPSSSEETDDERVQEMNDALSGNTPYERDRSDPLPNESPTETEQTQGEAIPAQAESRENNSQSAASDNPDIRRELIKTCENIGERATDEQKRKCRLINEFLTANSESGSLKVETFASDRAFAVPNARVVVFLAFPDGNRAIFDGVTDINGSTDSIILPAPPKSISQSPQSGTNPRLPYAVYSVYVEHPDYVRAVFTNVPVFSGIESIQPVRMLAKSSGLEEPEPIVVDETSLGALRNGG